jgi:hypothetical protein
MAETAARGFGTSPEYNYSTFLSEMGLRDTPDAKDTFRQYQNRMNALKAMHGPQTSPRLFTPDIDRAPARPVTPPPSPTRVNEARERAAFRIAYDDYLASLQPGGIVTQEGVNETLPQVDTAPARPSPPTSLAAPAGGNLPQVDTASAPAPAGSAPTGSASEPLFTFTRPQFDRLMKEEGLEKVSSAITQELDSMLGGGMLTREGLLDGTAPLLDVLPAYANLPPEQRRFRNDEAILALLTNVEDFGRYDSGGGDGRGGSSRAGFRALPAAGGMLAGTTIGFRAAIPIANAIPPVGLPGIIAKGGVLLGGGLIGAFAGMFAGQEAGEAILGEDYPIVPSLEPYRRGVETTVFGATVIASPYTLVGKVKPALGALEFINNFRTVAQGRFNPVAGQALELTARNAGLSVSGYKSAVAAQDAALRGPMIGGTTGTNVLGLTRFNPRGYVLNPTQGPVAARIIAGIEGGAGQYVATAAKKPFPFIGFEGLAAAGAGAGAFTTQQMFPYNEGARFIGEVLGAGIVPLAVKVPVEYGGDSARYAVNKIRQWYGVGDSGEGVLTNRAQREGAARILEALRRSEEYTGEDQIDALIQGLMAQSVDANGQPIRTTVRTLAAASGLPMNKTIASIEDSISSVNRELEVASASGRDQMTTMAKSAIFDLVNSGSPEAMAVAARLQQALFEESIIADMDNAVTNLYTAAERLLGRSPTAGSNEMDLSARLFNVLDAQLTRSKTRESELWGEVGRNYVFTEFRAGNNRVTTVPNVVRLLDRPLSNGGLQPAGRSGREIIDAALGTGLKQDIDELNRFFRPDPNDPNPLTDNPATADFMFEAYSNARDRSRTLRNNGLHQEAHVVDGVADALLRDITGVQNSDNAAYNAARAYTYARNNVFTRSFLGDMTRSDSLGREVVTPENMLRRLQQGNNAAIMARYNDIENAGKFALQNSLPRAAIARMETNEIITESMRASMMKIMDRVPVLNPATGRPMIDPATNSPRFTYAVNPKKYETFLQEPGTKEFLAAFPQIANDLRAVAAGRVDYDTMMSMMAQAKKSPETQAFQTVLEYSEAPAKAVARALSGSNPQRALQRYVDLIERSGDNFVDPITGDTFTKADALAGLRRAILDNGIYHSGGSGLGFRPTAFEDYLFANVRGTASSDAFNLAGFMRRNNLIDEDHIQVLQRSIREMRGIEEAFATGNLDQILFKNPSPSKALAVKFMGLTLGQAAFTKFKDAFRVMGIDPGGGIGGGMAAATEGRNAVTNLLLLGPETAVGRGMAELLQDPKKLGEVMKEVRTAGDARRLESVLSTVFGGGIRGTVRRAPYAIDYMTSPEDQTQPLPAPPPAAPPAAPPPNMPPPNQRGSLTPPRAPAPTGGGGAAATAPIQRAAAPQAPPPPSSGPVDRARFAAFFPNDSTTDLIRQQAASSGIGSLMGG